MSSKLPLLTEVFVVKEEIFHYHETKGMDNNGNEQASVSDPGWKEVEAPTAEDAFKKLPPAFQQKIKKTVEKMVKSWAQPKIKVGSPGWLDEFMGATAGWGLDWSFMNSVDWENTVEGEKDTLSR